VKLSEPFEVHTAIETLRNWLRTQHGTSAPSRT
jgi:hypothetical protein